MKKMSIRCYSELCQIMTFEERYHYLKLCGEVGADTFGSSRYLNQQFYLSKEWKAVRDKVIIRDNGCDLGIEGYEIYGKAVVHHMNPITPKDIEEGSPLLLAPEYLITTTHTTHNAIHYGDINQIPKEPVGRFMYDTCPWKKR